MSFNYGMFGIGSPAMMGMMGGMSGGGNVLQSLKAKYGCEDCYKKQPYWVECPKPVMPVPNEVINPKITSKIRKIIFG